MLKRDERELRTILADLQRSQAFLMSDRILVCTRLSAATTTLDLTNSQGDICCAISKEIGSDLVLLPRAIDRLERLLGNP